MIVFFKFINDDDAGDGIGDGDNDDVNDDFMIQNMDFYTNKLDVAVFICIHYMSRHKGNRLSSATTIFLVLSGNTITPFPL